MLLSAFTIFLTTSHAVAQGVQQPCEISIGTGIEEVEGITLQCSVYPNPATDILMLKIEGGLFSESNR